MNPLDPSQSKITPFINIQDEFIKSKSNQDLVNEALNLANLYLQSVLLNEKIETEEIKIEQS